MTPASGSETGVLRERLDMCLRPEPDPVGFARLRHAITVPESFLALDQYDQLVAGLTGRDTAGRATSFADMAERLAVGRFALASAVIALGTWLSQVYGKAPGVVQPNSADTLFGPMDIPPGAVLVPPGFDTMPGVPGNFAQATANVIYWAPDSTVIARFLARRTVSMPIALGYSHVAKVHYFARHGREESLHEAPLRADGTMALELAEAILDAWDLLDRRRTQAMRSLARLLQAATAGFDTTATTLDELKACAVNAAWLNEAIFAGLARYIVQARSDRNGTALRRSLQGLGNLVSAEPDAWFLTRIAEMEEGHVLRIAQLAGLPTEGITFAQDRALRWLIDQLGLAADADHLVAIGRQALEHGLDSKLAAALDARSEGKPDWAGGLAAAFRQCTNRALASTQTQTAAMPAPQKLAA